MSSGTVTDGSPLSVTVTLKELLPVLPCESVAVQVTPVVPSGKVLPEAGEQLASNVPSTASLAEAENATPDAPPALVANALIVPGTLTVGAVVSSTVTSKLADEVSLVSGLVAVQVTVVVPNPKVLPELGEQDTGLPSSAVGSVQEKLAPAGPVASTVLSSGTPFRAGGSACAACANRTSARTTVAARTSLARRIRPAAFTLLDLPSPPSLE
jgi:hypothetical protein